MSHDLVKISALFEAIGTFTALKLRPALLSRHGAAFRVARALILLAFNTTAPGRIKPRVETRREGRGGGRAIAICGSLTAHFNFKNRCRLLSAMPI